VESGTHDLACYPAAPGAIRSVLAA
jgi:hypothetical protein